MAKISYVERDNAPEDIKSIYDNLEKQFGVVPNVLKAMANSPQLFKGFMPFLGAVLGDTKVSKDLKELAIVTATKLCGCSYCTAHHTGAGKKAGLSQEQIDAAPDYNNPVFNDKEKAVVRFASELTQNVAASDESLNELRNHFDEEQIAVLNMVVGAFNVLPRFADTFKVELEQ